MTKKISTFSLVLAVGAALPAASAAQIPQASAAAFGLGNNMTASARGFAAVANNPAGLAHPSSPGFSLAVLPLWADVGLDPISVGDFADWEGQLIPDATKTDWLSQIFAAGGQTGSFGLGLTGLALNIGPIGFQVGGIAGGDVGLAPAAAELLLFGNAGLTGTPTDLSLAGSSVDGFVLSTAALSYGFRASRRLYVGVTGTYTIGNGLLIGRDAGSSVTSNPLGVQLEFPILLPRTDDPPFNHGTGVGMDVGAIWVGPMITLGGTIQNVFHTFEWKIDDMSFIPGEAVFDQANDSSDFDEQPASAAPASLLAAVDEATIKPVLSAGALWRPNSLLSVQADIRKRVGGGLAIGPETHAGVGAELRVIPFLPLRAHVSVMSGGTQIGGGASLVLGPVNLSGAGAVRTGGNRDAVLAMFTLSFGAN